MMTIDRFEVTIELMPLLQGEFRVVSMRLDRPHARIAVGEDGRLDWQKRNEASKALDPDKVILESVEVADGRIDYVDRAAGTQLSFENINAVIEANSLAGPWRIEGSFLDEGQAVPFRFATGRRLEDGTIRVKTELSPAGWAVALTADGVLGNEEDSLAYDGTYNLTEVLPVTPEENGEAAGQTTGWRSEGKFKLTRQQLAIEQAVLSGGPPERPYSVAGSLKVDLGLEPRFVAHASARQIDLDRSLGEGPTKPVDVATAANALVGRLTNSFVPTIPGSVFFSVPGIVVGGSVIQDVAFEARPTIGGWRLASLKADLPGQASVEARGVLATDHEVSFGGDVRLVVNQPAVFATWWRGRSEEGSGRLLAPFQLAGRAEIAPKRFALENIDAEIGEAAITGRFAWSEAEARRHRRILAAELVAGSVDFTQLKALGELIAGKDFANTAALADSYDVELAAGTLQFEDVTMSDVAIDASFADAALTVNQFGIGDLGGANLHVTQGRIESLTTRPRGHLDAQLEAVNLTGVTRVVERLLPGHPFSQWLAHAAPALSPAFITASIEAPPQEGGAEFRVNLGGVAASTTLSAVFDLSGSLDQWRQGNVGIEILLDSPEAAELARQVGLAATGSGEAEATHIEITAKGVPASGLDTRIASDLAGVGVRSTGTLTLAAGAPPAFSGSLAAAADDIAPLARMMGLVIPGATAGTSARIEGRIDTRGQNATLTLKDSRIAGRFISGNVSVGRAAANDWRLDGDLSVDTVDLGWIMALGLGSAIKPTGDPAAPWSKAPFGEPGYGPVTGRLALASEALTIADGFNATGATMVLDLQPNRVSLDVGESQIVGGSMSGRFSIHNVAGTANASGRIDLKGAALESLVWRRGGRAVATGALDLTAEFEAAGRSPAGFISSLTGGGTLAVRDAEARYLNPQAARLVIQAADLGQEFTENELLDDFTKQIDAGSLAFDEAEGAFAIVAGAARLKSMTLASEGTKLIGNAVVDLNTLTLDSDWTVEFESGDDKDRGITPQVGIVFRGPLAQPDRIIDVVQFGSYLNIRREERLLEILSQAESDRLERERLNRERRKVQEDADWRVRQAELERQRLAAAETAERAADGAQRVAMGVIAARHAAAEEKRRIAEEVARRREALLERRRLADEQARKAAEAAARAVEEEAARRAAEEEAARLAAEAAAMRGVEAASQILIKAERRRAEEAARKAEEEAAARRVAEAERQRLAAEEAAERERLAAEARTRVAPPVGLPREADARRARDTHARAARTIAVFAASAAADAAVRSTNGASAVGSTRPPRPR